MKAEFFNRAHVLTTVILSLSAQPCVLRADDNLTNTAASTPRIHFTESTHDFGRIVMGDVVKHEYHFTNSGLQPLLITEVTSTCGCTTAMGLGKVEPGNEGRIPVEFYSSGLDGPFKKTVQVKSNDPDNPTITLELTGVVWRPIDVKPANAAFPSLITSAVGLEKTITIKNQEQKPLKLSGAQSSSKAVSAFLKTKVEGQEYELVVRLLPPLGSGNIFGEVRIPTSSKAMPMLTVPVWAMAQPGIMVFPPKILMPAGPLPKQTTYQVLLRNNVENALVLSSPTSSQPDMKVQLTELQQGQQFAVKLTFPEGYSLPAEGATVTFQSNNPRCPEARIKIELASE